MPHRTGSRFTIHIHNRYSCIPLGRLQSSKFQSAAPFCIHEPEWRSEIGELLWKQNGQHVLVLIQILSSAWLHHAQNKENTHKNFFFSFFFFLTCGIWIVKEMVMPRQPQIYRISFFFLHSDTPLSKPASQRSFQNKSSLWGNCVFLEYYINILKEYSYRV